MDIDSARTLMEEWTQSPALRVHMEAVAACMRPYARRFEPDREDLWAVTGLLHDFDYERHPSAAEHPAVGVAHLRGLGAGAEVLDAILGHAEHTGTLRTTAMAKALFAVDELAGFIVACTKVRPRGIVDLTAASVLKKLKDKAFAAAVSREDIRKGAAELGVGLEEHVATCIDALRAGGARLGLGG